MEFITKSQLADEGKKHRKKKKSLRHSLGLPIGGVLFASPYFSNYDGGADSDFGGGEGIAEMIQIAKDLQDQAKKSGKPYEVYDVEEIDEAGIPAHVAQFEVDLTDKQVNEKKYAVHFKHPETQKIVEVEYSDPNLQVKQAKKPSIKKIDKDDDQGQHFRKWSAKYWKQTPIKGALSEIINPDEVDVTTIKVNDDLSPLLWKDGKLDEEVRDTLLKIAIEFIKFCKIEEYKYKDIVLVGSMANFNYTPQSDLDLHIILDFNQFKVNEDILGEYFSTKKDMWAQTHDIKIKDHDVECYVQNVNEPNASIGIYSLMKNDWVREPIKKFVTIDEANVQLKAADFMNAIEKLEERFKNGEDIGEAATKIKEKIKKGRKNGLYKEGEYSTENLVFKVLRNSGYLDRLTNLKNNNTDQNLSL